MVEMTEHPLIAEGEQVNTHPAPKIDPEFKALLPTLTSEERDKLERNLIAEGKAIDPIKLWQGIVIDGHHRLEICSRLGLPYETVEIEEKMNDRDDVKLWIVRHQDGRRSLTPFTRSELALLMEPIIAAKARANLAAGGGDKKSPDAKSGCPNLANPIAPVDTRAELAKIAKVSHGTIAKARVIAAKADEETKQRLRTGDESIHRAYTEIKNAEREGAREASAPTTTEEDVVRGTHKRAPKVVGSSVVERAVVGLEVNTSGIRQALHAGVRLDKQLAARIRAVAASLNNISAT